ncbi:efflux RND transporter permease subunit [Sphingobacterium siyangense]|uniref:efflux RND transporter permease subunit n=1 Tax=Sphingobacterium siyangense TaxID=459529 RepID=UPI00200CFBDD|nr:efflux RND transporter permease subunit [Sphingobacterium siyangense]UQA74002.1 efflux RND transporter permease subunit [Sphingobacterium siyangense]
MVTSFRLIIIFFILGFISIFSIRNLNFQLNKNSAERSLEISFSTFKTTPEETEQYVTSKIENALSRIDNIKTISSFSTEDNGSIKISFNTSSNLTQKRFDILLNLRQVFENLPPGTTFPIISQIGQGSEKQPLISYSISGISNSEINSIKTIFEKIFRNNDIPATLEVTGGSRKIIQIEYDKNRMYSRKVAISDVISSLQGLTNENYLGNVTEHGMNYFVRLASHSVGTSALEEIVLKNTPLVKLRDIATISETYEKNDFSYRINGKNTALIHIYEDQSENVLTTYSKISEVLDKIKKELPEGSELRLEQDNSKHLRKLVRIAMINGAITLLLIALVLLLFKNWKYLLIVITTIIINFCILVLIYSLFKIPIDLITLNSISFILSLLCFNLLIALGQFDKIGKRRIQQSQIIIFLIAASIYMAIEFLDYQDLHQLQSILKFSIIVIAVGTITNFLFANSLHNLLTKNSNRQKSSKNLTVFTNVKIIKFRYIILFLVLSFTGIPLFMLPSKIEGNNTYNKIFGTTLIQDKIIPVSSLALGGMWRLFHENIYVNTDFEDSQETSLNIYAEQPIGATAEQMKSSLEYLEKFLSDTEYIELYVSQVFSGQRGTIRVKFLNDIPIHYPEKLRQQLINASQNLGGVGWTFFGIGKGFSNKMTKEHPSFQLKISGYNFAKLKEIGEFVKTEISKNDRINSASLASDNQFISDNNHEYKMSVNDRQLAQLELDDKNVKSELILNNSEIMDKKMIVNIYNENIPIKITAKNQDNLTINEFLTHSIRLEDRYIKPNSITTFLKADRVESIVRENRQYIQILNLKYVGSLETGYKYLLEETERINKNLPEGYLIDVLSDHESSKPLTTKLLIFLSTTSFIFILLTIRLNSFRKAGLVFLMVYISLSAIFVTFYIGDFKFDEGGQASFIFTIIIGFCYLLYFWGDLGVVVKIEGSRIHLRQNIKLISLSFLIVNIGNLTYLITQFNDPFWSAFSIGILASSIAIVFITTFVIPLFSVNKDTLK